jgi:hypothetical protein
MEDCSVGLLDRIAASVLVGDECWNWIGERTPKGYGRMRHGSEREYAHRVLYELLVGPIPEGSQLDHLCRNRACVRPAHLEPVTCRENLMRGQTLAAENAAKTRCPRGHPYDEVNTYVDPSGARRCRVCARNCRSARRER